ncbi:MAG: F0F1 ATP synthase subunit C, F-type H+-transporting ATPase subunit c [Candidatus Peregrinibacteria bacterium GW2011_GWF2_33_10]|nr:MAG: F0F1 ATP synthase subunit C, F-type H+-transporting ATPase subunit c [Candidatus Peregrinibacteria bacterium GW2011_GWF2_33_10]OGJ45765.1 MAG: ATP synthase F0 subunit C [Candidatus Peregrinibacteria bacterium RIFOXYA2_FULL_33_21]OGJ46825.1 MAG: ATP synthase F0 subunit C [Candidatus Peregrinibacteria bacterium RIFOXYA12_FULL_33_12]OGJ51295.1 MAG: ATP synthase F0 subunit C [Candidatus Peregrinibacteria bacterium RIFOXYB2_FULL_33_20]
MELSVIKAIAAAVCIAVSTISPAIAQGKIGSSALESMARNPQIADKIGSSMILAMALAEALTIYGLVVSLIILFVLK